MQKTVMLPASRPKPAPPACTALRSANRSAGRFGLSAPRQPLSAVTGLTLQSPPQFSPIRDRTFATAFHSPVTTLAFANTITESKLPACCFMYRLTASVARSALLLLDRNPVCPGVRPNLSFWPVAASTVSRTCVIPGFRSPSGLLHPSRSKRSTRSPLVGPPSEKARYRSLPAADFYC